METENISINMRRTELSNWFHGKNGEGRVTIFSQNNWVDCCVFTQAGSSFLILLQWKTFKLRLYYTCLMCETDRSREALWLGKRIFPTLHHILLEDQQKGSAEAQDSMVKNEQTGELGGRKTHIAINNEILITWILDFLREIHCMIIISQTSN